jgi:hypothetical protein
MKDREITCVFYEYEGCCRKGREGTFRKACQTCNKYQAKRGSVPARKNLKKQKIERARDKDLRRQIKEY